MTKLLDNIVGEIFYTGISCTKILNICRIFYTGYVNPEAFVKQINVTSDYIERISNGEIPAKISDEYKGDASGWSLTQSAKNKTSCPQSILASIR